MHSVCFQSIAAFEVQSRAFEGATVIVLELLPLATQSCPFAS